MALLNSSFVKRAEWIRGNLHVQLASGLCYRYDNVDERVYLELCQAASPGRYFNEEIRNRYVSHRVPHWWR